MDNMWDSIPDSTPVELIREVFHYQARFEGSTMVFKIDYPITLDPGFPGLVKDLALLAKTGFKVIIVPGAKENIDAVLQQYNITCDYISINGYDMPVRITSAKAVPFVEMAAFNSASKFMTLLSGSRVEAVIGNFVRARGLGIQNGIDTGHLGTVDKIYADSLNKTLDLGMVPILPCIGWSSSGKPYNVPSNEIALAVSSALKAAKLFILSAQDGLRAVKFAPNTAENLELRQDGSLIRLTPAQAEKLINTLQDSDQSALSASPTATRELKLAINASRAGVDRIHIIDGREEGSILRELFSNLGTGIMIHNDEYNSIRALKSSDLPDILRLMEPLMQKGILIRRNSEQIIEKKADYYVLEIDGSIRACGALHNWGESQGEIAAIATDPQYTELGLGRQIINFLVDTARKTGLHRVFVLTTLSQDWFEALGFKEAAVETLPEQKRKVYDQGRRSKVFSLKL